MVKFNSVTDCENYYLNATPEQREQLETVHKWIIVANRNYIYEVKKLMPDETKQIWFCECLKYHALIFEYNIEFSENKELFRILS